MFRSLVFFFILIHSAMAGERMFHQPLAKLKAEEVKEMRIAVTDFDNQPGKSRAITDRDFIRKLLGLVTPKDYPESKDVDGSMSMPGSVLKLEFIGEERRVLATLEMLGAWNLMYAKVPGMDKSVTGSNRQLCEELMKQLETLDPKAHAEITARYREYVSGKYPRELHEVLEKDKR